MMRVVKSFLAGVVIVLSFPSGWLVAQPGTAGTQGLFITGGVGARAMGLGNAFVAWPQDPSVIYWNPGGLDYISRKSITLFYTNLLAGAQYNFVGYAHPTISIGTFGIGVIRVGIGEIEERDESNVFWGNFSFSQYEFLFSYSKQLPYSLSLGISVKVEHQAFGKYSDTGIGADVGLLYRPNFTNFFLKNTSFGLVIQNAVAPRLKPGGSSEAIPHNIKFGIARPIRIAGDGNEVVFFADFDKGDLSPFKFHAGSEYIFREMAMLRVGTNNGQIVFGAGAIYDMFQLDYSYSELAENEFSPSHRISLTIRFGKTKSELIQIAKERRMREIEQEVTQRIEWNIIDKITTSLDEGKKFFEEGDYFRAYREFAQVLGFKKERPNLPEIAEAEEMLKKTDKKIEEQREKELEEKRARSEEERQRLELEKYVNEHFEKGLRFFEIEDYANAIREWQLVLDRAPDNELAKEWKANAEAEFKKTVLALIHRADGLARVGKYIEALGKLDEARNLEINDAQIERMIRDRRVRYEKFLKFWEIYRQGVNYYNTRDFKAAMEAFERASNLDPGNKNVQRYYEAAKARAMAQPMKMTGKVKAEYFRGVKLFTQGKYEEAVKIWEKLLKIQPYNKQILDDIDRAKERIKRQNHKNP